MARLMRDLIQECLDRASRAKVADGVRLTDAEADGLYQAIARRVPLTTANDKALAAKVAVAVGRGLLVQCDALDAAEAVRIMQPRNPVGYFRACINEKARQRSIAPQRIWRIRIPSVRRSS